MKITAQHYGQFLINSPVNFTGTYFADTATGLAHDSVQRFLTNAKMQPNMLREKTLTGIDDDPKGFVIFDDTVLDKNHSRAIELVRKHYSGNAHRVIRGIGVVTCVYVNPETHTFDVLDYRIWDAGGDGKTKLEHVRDMSHTSPLEGHLRRHTRSARAAPEHASKIGC